MSSNSMSQAQAQAVATQLSQALAQALEGRRRLRPSPATERRSPKPAGRGERAFTRTRYQRLHLDREWRKLQFAHLPDEHPCDGPQGGTISVTGDIDGILNNFRQRLLSANSR